MHQQQPGSFAVAMTTHPPHPPPSPARPHVNAFMRRQYTVEDRTAASLGPAAGPWDSLPPGGGFRGDPPGSANRPWWQQRFLQANLERNRMMKEEKELVQVIGFRLLNALSWHDGLSLGVCAQTHV